MARKRPACGLSAELRRAGARMGVASGVLPLDGAPQVKGEQLAQSGIAQWSCGGPLEEIEAGALVALDELGTVVGQSDVPADHDLVAESLRVRPTDQRE